MKVKRIFFAVFVITVLSLSIILSNIFAKDIKLFAGAVKNIDMNQGIITLKNDRDGESTFVLGQNVVVKANDNSTKTVNDIKVGDIAALVYDEVEGKRIAKSITIVPRVPRNKTTNP
jgi:predicted RNA-binding protein